MLVLPEATHHFELCMISKPSPSHVPTGNQINISETYRQHIIDIIQGLAFKSSNPSLTNLLSHLPPSELDIS